ncbi:Xpo1 [Symbiodinium natans]|uniref:Xpo1 protein n=1 Tax=Symbiodinium natans TaxID=878477 RepID=A0A812GVB2_9DINO|nr:Xpo1 [Symbiodinium natans]
MSCEQLSQPSVPVCVCPGILGIRYRIGWMEHRKKMLPAALSSTYPVGSPRVISRKMGCGGSAGMRTLSVEGKSKIEELFDKMDKDTSGTITKEEAHKFFSSFAKVNAKAMFDEVDDDGNGSITKAEWVGFWQQVRSAGYSNEQILEELELMTDGGDWVNWKDGKDVAAMSRDKTDFAKSPSKAPETPQEPEAKEETKAEEPKTEEAAAPAEEAKVEEPQAPQESQEPVAEEPPKAEPQAEAAEPAEPAEPAVPAAEAEAPGAEVTEGTEVKEAAAAAQEPEAKAEEPQ